VNVFPKIPNSQNATTEREKKQKEYPPTSLLCKPGVTQRLTGRLASLNRFISRSAERNFPFFEVPKSAEVFQ
jgi:ribonuclease HI